MEDMNDVQNIETVSDGKQYIVVRIGTEQYGIDIKYVDNIVRNQRITRIPKAQPYFKGVINLRGEIIPVMSLRLKFGLEPDEYTNTTRIIIIKLEPQSAPRRLITSLVCTYFTSEIRTSSIVWIFPRGIAYFSVPSSTMRA